MINKLKYQKNKIKKYALLKKASGMSILNKLPYVYNNIFTNNIFIIRLSEFHITKIM